MEFTNSTINGGVEILRNDHYVAIPGTIDFSSVTATDNGLKIVKAGTPMKLSSGKYVVDNSATATAILHYDVREDRPIGAMIIHGFVDQAKAEASFGAAYASVSIANVDIR